MSGFDDFMNDYTNIKIPGIDKPLDPVASTVATAAKGGNPLKNTPYGDIFGIPSSAQDSAQNNAQTDITNAVGAYNGLTPPTFDKVSLQGPTQAPDAIASRAAPSAMGGIAVNPAYSQAQEAQMTALGNLAQKGGRNAASDANLAQIQNEQNQNAAGQRGAALASLNARGMGSSGQNLLAQLSANQNAATNQNAMDLGVAGQEANTALAAGQGAAGIGANLQNQSFGEQAAKAQAQDAVNAFNAGNATQASEFNANKNQGVNNAAANAANSGQVLNNFTMPQQTYADQAQKAGGQAGAYTAGTGYWGQQANIAAQQQGNVLGAGAKLGAAAMSSGAAAAAAFGGKTPGAAVVPGNSTLNDFVPIMSSPGEVHVPRTLVKTGTPAQIGQYVKHAPAINPNPAKNKEAMLSALERIRQRGKVAV